MWSDWGKPNFLTRAGIPRIVTNLTSYLLAVYISFSVTMRSVSDADREKYRFVIHNAYFISAFVIAYVSLLTSAYIRSHKSNGIASDQRFPVGTEFAKRSIFVIFWLSLAATLCLFLIGAVEFRHYLSK